MHDLATWCGRHRRAVALLWAVVLVATIFAAQTSSGANHTNSLRLPTTPSSRALTLLQSAAPRLAGDNEQVVVQTSGALRVTDPPSRAGPGPSSPGSPP